MQFSTRITRRDALRTAAAAGATGALAARLPIARAAQNTTITVASFYPVDQTSGWPGLVSQFEHDHPGVKVETQVTSFSAYLPKLETQLASGTMPDVVGIEQSFFQTAVKDGVLLDLTSRMAKQKAFNRSDFFPKILAHFTYHGRNYGIPYDCQPVAGFFYNRTLFDKAKVSYPTKSWTWADMLAAAKPLTIRSGSRFAQYGFDPGDGSWMTFVYAYGGRIVDNFEAPRKFVLDSPEAIAGLQAFVNLYQGDGQVAPTPNLVAGTTASGIADGDLFIAGKIAMYVAGYWQLVFGPQKFANINLGYAMIPAGPKGARGYNTGGTCYSVSSGSKNPDLAFEFVQYFMGIPGWQAAYNSANHHAIYPPAYKPAYYSKLFLNMPDPPVQNIGINGQGEPYAIFTPSDPNWTEINTKLLEPAIQSMIQERAPVAETITKLNPQLTAGLSVNQH